jgi:hypothetical protein
MTILEGLLIAHVLGDWLLQTEWQARNKAGRFGALLTHLLIYHAVVFIILYFGYSLDIVPVVGVVLGLAVTHGILDGTGFLSRIVRLLRLIVDRQPEKWMLVAFDQAVHFVLLAAAAFILVHWGN